MERQYVLTQSEYVELKELLNRLKLDANHIDQIGHYGYTVEGVRSEVIGTVNEILSKIDA